MFQGTILSSSSEPSSP